MFLHKSLDLEVQDTTQISKIVFILINYLLNFTMNLSISIFKRALFSRLKDISQVTVLSEKKLFYILGMLNEC